MKADPKHGWDWKVMMAQSIVRWKGWKGVSVWPVLGPCFPEQHSLPH